MSVSQLKGNQCECAACGQLFNSVTAFDKHQIISEDGDDIKCLSPVAMMLKGMSISEAGFWITKPNTYRVPVAK